MQCYSLSIFLTIALILLLQSCSDAAEESTAPIIKSEKPVRSAIYPDFTLINTDINMQLTCTPSSDCKIYYNVNKPDISIENATLYPGNPVNFASNEYKDKLTTVRYFAINEQGKKEKIPNRQEYIIDQVKPTGVTLSDADGTPLGNGPYERAQKISITCATDIIISGLKQYDLGCATMRYAFVPGEQTSPPADMNGYESISIQTFITIQENGTLYYYGEDSAKNTSTNSPLEHTFYFSNSVTNVVSLTTSSSQTQIELSWLAPNSGDVAGYVIHRSLTQAIIDPTNPNRIVYDGPATVFSDNTVEPGKEYYYSVFAYINQPLDGILKRKFSTGVTVIVAAIADIAPAVVTKINTFPGDSEVTFTWTNPADLDLKNIVIRRITAPSEAFLISNGKTSFTDIGLVNDKVYSYTFTSVDDGGQSSAAVPISATPFSAPGDVTNFGITALDTQLKLSWINPTDTDLAGVRIMQSTLGAPIDEVLSSGELAAGDKIAYEGLGDSIAGSELRTTIITGLNNGTVYYFRIFAFDKGQLFSNAVTAPADNGTPKADALTAAVVDTMPNSISGVAPTIGSLKITFNKAILASSLVANNNITLVDDQTNATITGTATLDPTDPKIVIYTIDEPQLSLSTAYTATVSNGVTDLNGKPVTAYTWGFTTADGTWSSLTQALENIDNNSAIASTEKQIAFDASGNAIAVWEQFVPRGSGGIRTIFANQYNALTGWDSTLARQISTIQISAIRPHLAVMENGNAVAVWVRDVTGGKNVWAASYTTSTGWQAPFEVQDQLVEAATPKVVIDTAGVVTFAWLQDNAGILDVHVRRIPFADINTTAVFPASKTIETSTLDTHSLQLATDANGNVVAVWVQWDAASNTSSLMYNYYDTTRATGADWATSELGPINTDVSFGISALKIKMALTGTAVAVWVQDNKVHASHFGTTAAWQTDTTLSSVDYTQMFSDNVGLDIHADGTALAFWSQRTLSSGAGVSIIARLVPLTGWSPVEVVNPRNGHNYQVAMDNSGHALLVWSDNNNVNGLRYTAGMVLAKLRARPAYPLESGSGRVFNSSFGSVAVDNQGNALAVFASAIINAAFDMRANRFSFPTEKPNLSVSIDNISSIKNTAGNIDLTLKYTVSNSGTGQSGPFNVDLWTNGDPANVPTLGQTGEQTTSHVSLAGNTTISKTVVIATSSSATIGTPYIIVDSLNTVAESSENDNVTKGRNWEYLAPIVLQINFEQSSFVPIEIKNVFNTANWSTITKPTNHPTLRQLKSGIVTNAFARSCFELNPIQSSSVSFDLLVNSVAANKLEFYIDNSRKNSWPGKNGNARWNTSTMNWSTDKLATPPSTGIHTYKWCYYHVSTPGTGENAAWVDSIVVRE